MSPETILCLRTCEPDGTSHNGFKWPLEVGAHVKCTDFDPDPTRACGGGLHGLPWGEGDGSLLDWSGNAVWIVYETDNALPAVGGKCRCRSATVRHVGGRESATRYLWSNGAVGRAIVGSAVTGGDYATVTGGDCATVTGGNYATVIGGYRATVTGGHCATVTGGNYATVTGGYHAAVIGGDYATVTGRDCATVTGGDYATVTGGYRATVIGGYRATVIGGDCATLLLWYGDTASHHKRLAVGYVGENGLKPNVAYRLNVVHQFVEV